MEHQMKLNKSGFLRMKQGLKLREYRVNDEKRKKVRVGDTICFSKLPNLDEQLIMDVKEITFYDSLEEAVRSHFEEDFFSRHKNVSEVVDAFYNKGYYSPEEVKKDGIVVFTLKKHRIVHANATACYLKKDNKVLMIHFEKKWGHVYSPPGGKFESGETPLDCMIREFYEETGLTLINPRLQGISYWRDSIEGMIFIFTAEDYTGTLKDTSEEGTLEWIDFEKLERINQFDQNLKFTPYLFKKEIFEGKFLLDNSCKVLDYEIRFL